MKMWMTFFSSLALSLLLSLTLAFAEDAYFKRDTLNPGLSEAPAFVDRSTPRQTIETLYRLADAGDWDNAAQLIDLPGLAPALQAPVGAVTLVVGFAARRNLDNMLASLRIALNQSARIGDRVVFKDHLCHVERINFTYVQLRDWDGTRLVVPVEEFISETFENWTLKEPELLRILKYKLQPDVDMARLRTAFSEVLDTLAPEELDDRDKAQVVVTGQDVFGIDVWFYVPCADPNTSWDIACEAREILIGKINDLQTGDDRPIFPEAHAAEAA